MKRPDWSAIGIALLVMAGFVGFVLFIVTEWGNP